MEGPWLGREGREAWNRDGWLDGNIWDSAVLGEAASGKYVVELVTDDPSGGEGPGPAVDTKQFTVR